MNMDTQKKAALLLAELAKSENLTVRLGFVVSALEEMRDEGFQDGYNIGQQDASESWDHIKGEDQ
jgi:hypothetical protein